MEAPERRLGKDRSRRRGRQLRADPRARRWSAAVSFEDREEKELTGRALVIKVTFER
jgi:hypothetical protein